MVLLPISGVLVVLLVAGAEDSMRRWALDFDRDYRWAWEQYTKTIGPLQGCLKYMERQMRKKAKTFLMTDPHYRAYIETSTPILLLHARLTVNEFHTLYARWSMLKNALSE